jgi:uncharacterized protein (TIGR03435 family)
MAERGVFPAQLLLLAGLMTVALPLCAQGTAPIPNPVAYDVVAIKPNPAANGMMRIGDRADGFSASNIPLSMLIHYAYNLKTDAQLSGLPGWADAARFDVESKMDDENAAALKQLPREQAAEQRRQMMQKLLADRFQLRVHRITKDLPLYALVVAKGGLKLIDANPNDTYPNGIKASDGTSRAGMTQMRDGQLRAQGIPMSRLVDILSVNLDRIVVDKTGLTGKYDMTLQWSPDDVMNHPHDTSAPPAPSLFTALQEQLGLKLESTKGPVDTIVVDHVAMPSEN